MPAPPASTGSSWSTCPPRRTRSSASRPGQPASTSSASPRPTTDDRRLPRVLTNTSGFVYYVSITGITGAGAASAAAVAPEVARIKRSTDLPVCVGFGIRTPGASGEIAAVADGAVVGTAIVDRIGAGDPPDAVLAFVRTLAEAAHRAV